MALLPLSYSLGSLAARWRSTLLATIGIGLVVAVFVAILSMAAGFRLALRTSGTAGNAIVLQKGAQSELGSFFSTAGGRWVADDPRVARGPDGTPVVSPELVAVVTLPSRSHGKLANVGVRGVTRAAFDLRPGVSIVAGRRARTGLFEVTVGIRAQHLVRGLEIGSRVSLMRHGFEVVGAFAAEGSVFESEIWGDFDAMASAFNRPNTENSLTVRLTNSALLPAFNRDLESNLRYPLTMSDERKYYESQTGSLVGLLRGLAVFVGFVMGTGAVFAAMNTMYAIVANRTREVGTLRALGFSRISVLLAFVLEGLLLALTGGVLGCALSLFMDLASASTAAAMGEISFAFRVTPADLGSGLLFAGAMGIIGSLLPALRAARLPLVSALRA